MAEFVPNQGPPLVDPRRFQPNFLSNGLAALNQYGQQQDAPPSGADLGMTAQQAGQLLQSRFTPQTVGRYAPSAFNPNQVADNGVALQNVVNAARQIPGVAGLSDALTAEGHPAQPGEYGTAFGQKVPYARNELVGQGPLNYLWNNPAALGPGSAILDPFAGASQALSGAKAVAGGAKAAGTAAAGELAAQAVKIPGVESGFLAGEAGAGKIPGAGRTVGQELAARQQAALDAAGQPNPFASIPQDFSKVAGENRSITAATGVEMSPSLLTRTAQTALGTAEGGGMPEVLKAYTYPAFDAAGKRRPVGVPEAVSRAVLANDAEVVSRLGPEVTQQVAQNAIAGIARKANVAEDAIRQALQIMEHAPDRVSSEAMNAIADSVKTGRPIPADLGQMVFAAQHSALSQVGLPVTDLTTSLLRAQLVAKARAAAAAAAKAGDAQEALLAELRRAGVGDAQIAQDLRGMGVPAAEVAKAVPGAYPSGIVPAALTDAERAAAVARARAGSARQPYVTPPVVGPAALTDAERAAAVARSQTGSAPQSRLFSEPYPGAVQPNVPAGPPGPPLPPRAVSAPQPSMPQRAASAFANGMGESLDALRTAKAIGDVSQLGRQGLVPVVAAALSRSPLRRVIARDAFVNAIRGYGDKYAGQVWEGAMNDPLFVTWKAAGGTERVIPASSLSHLQSSAVRSELFKSNLLEGAPVVGGLVRVSDRSFSLTLDALSFYSWKDGYAAIKAGGRVVTNVEQKALANWYNVATGTGNVKGLDGLNKIFWAPRFAVSRVQAPYYAIKYLADPATREVGKLAATDLGKTVAAGIGFLKVAELAGFKVGWNPQATDFGKVCAGNTCWDIWGGYQQPAVFAARVVTDWYISQAGRGSSLSGSGSGGTDIPALVTRFLQSKLGPGQGLLLAGITGKDFTGQPFGPRGGQTIADAGLSLLASGEVAPLSWVDVITATIDDLKNGTSVEHGLPPGTLGVASGVASLGGVSISTYDRTVGRDGLGRDLKGSLPPSPVLDAWAAVRAGSEKGVKGSPSFPDLVSPDDTIGKVLLTPKETDSLAVLTGRVRDAMLSQVVSSPRWLTMGQVDKERALAEAKAFADRIGREQFALGLASTAVDDPTKVRAVKVALTGADRAQTMDVLTKLTGTLTQNVKAAIDSERTVTDPTAKGYQLTVDQHLQGGVLVAQYLSFPAYRIGDPTVWAAASKEIGLLKTARDAMDRIATARGVPVQQLDSWKQYLADYQKTVAGFPVSRFMDLNGTVRETAVSTQRLALSQDKLWHYFEDIAKKRDPYYPR